MAMTTIHKGRLCGSWEATVERNRATLVELPEAVRENAEQGRPVSAANPRRRLKISAR